MRKFTIILLLTLALVPAIADDVIYLTTEQFRERIFDYTKDRDWKYKGDKPCIIDFYTTWCGPCKRLAPIMEELSQQYCDQVVFYKADTERERELAYLFQISSLNAGRTVGAEFQLGVGRYQFTFIIDCEHLDEFRKDAGGKKGSTVRGNGKTARMTSRQSIVQVFKSTVRFYPEAGDALMFEPHRSVEPFSGRMDAHVSSTPYIVIIVTLHPLNKFQ